MDVSTRRNATIASEVSSRFERGAAASLVAVLLIGTLAALPWHARTGPQAPQFVAAFAAATGIADAFAATLLLNLCRLDRRRSTVYTCAAYLCSAVLVGPYGWLFPGVVTPDGAPGNSQSSAWLWLVMHFTFPAFVALGALDRGAAARRTTTFLTSVGGGAVAAVVFVVAGRNSLPVLLAKTTFSPLFSVLAGLAAAATAIAIVVLLRSRPLTSLQLWLLVALSAAFLDTFLNAFAPARYSTIWYVGKAEQFVASTAVLVSLIGAWTALSARAVVLAERLGQTRGLTRDLQSDLDREHRASSAFQDAALPRSLPVIDGLELAAHFRSVGSATFVGGDWFDAFAVDEDRVVLVVGDVMGHGLAAAVIMNAVRQAIRGAALAAPHAGEILRVADRALLLEDPNAMVTVFVGIIDMRSGELTYKSAGHPPAVVRRRGGSIEALHVTDVPLGIRFADAASDEPSVVTLSPDSLLVLYTDGLIESRHDAIAGEAHLHALLGERKINASLDPASALVAALVEVPLDDVAVLTARFSGATGGERLPEGERWTFSAHDAGGAARVREAVVATLARAGATSDDCFAAELVFSELVGNVVRHGGGRADVVLCFEDGLPVLHVLDRGPGFVQSPRLPMTNLSESGRGLYIVSSFARDVAMTQRRGGGAHVRANLRLESEDQVARSASAGR